MNVFRGGVPCVYTNTSYFQILTGNGCTLPPLVLPCFDIRTCVVFLHWWRYLWIKVYTSVELQLRIVLGIVCCSFLGVATCLPFMSINTLIHTNAYVCTHMCVKVSGIEAYTYAVIPKMCKILCRRRGLESRWCKKMCTVRMSQKSPRKYVRT